MSTTPVTSDATADAAGVPTVPMRLEVTTPGVDDIEVVRERLPGRV